MGKSCGLQTYCRNPCNRERRRERRRFMWRIAAPASCWPRYWPFCIVPFGAIWFGLAALLFDRFGAELGVEPEPVPIPPPVAVVPGEP